MRKNVSNENVGKRKLERYFKNGLCTLKVPVLDYVEEIEERPGGPEIQDVYLVGSFTECIRTVIRSKSQRQRSRSMNMVGVIDQKREEDTTLREEATMLESPQRQVHIS